MYVSIGKILNEIHDHFNAIRRVKEKYAKMSAKSIKQLREKFEKKNGFSAADRDGEIYKTMWRKWKKEAKDEI